MIFSSLVPPIHIIDISGNNQHVVSVFQLNNLVCFLYGHTNVHKKTSPTNNLVLRQIIVIFVSNINNTILWKSKQSECSTVVL